MTSKRVLMLSGGNKLRRQAPARRITRLPGAKTWALSRPLVQARLAFAYQETEPVRQGER